MACNFQRHFKTGEPNLCPITKPKLLHHLALLGAPVPSIRHWWVFFAWISEDILGWV